MTAPKLILPLYPVTDITIGPLPEHRMIVLRPDFLSPATPPQSKISGKVKANTTKPTQTAASPIPQQGRTYVLSRSQARYLQEQLQRSLQILEAELGEHPASESGAQPEANADK